MIGFSGSNINDQWVNQIVFDAKNNRIGGITISKKNIEGKIQIKKITNAFREANVFVATREDGKNGVLSYFDITYPSQNFIGKNYDLNKTSALYKKLANELAGLNVNLNLAPIVDFGDTEFSFSKNPDEQTSYLNEFIEAFKDKNIKCALKFFPGSKINKNYDFSSLKPYYDLIKRQNIDFIILSHESIEDIDFLPISMSYKAITNLLKNKFNFSGVVISGDLLSHELDKYTIEERIINTINAGSDMIYISEYFLRTSNAIKLANDTIFNAVKSGKIAQSRIEDAYNRIIKTKSN